MIDRPARNLLVGAIDSFLNSEILPGAFGYAVLKIAAATKDVTAHYVAETVVDAYDDLPPQDLERCDWNLLQRIRLVLRSDCEMVFVRQDAIVRQCAAVACLGLIAGTAWLTGNSWELHFVCLIAGWVLWGIARRELDPNPYQEIVFPFVSFRQLANVYGRTPGFRKERFPKHFAKPETFVGVRRAIGGLLSSIGHALFMPLIVLVECFPSGDWRVVDPRPLGTSSIMPA